MSAGPNIAEIAALLGDPARTNIVVALMDGRALPASELAFRAGVTPQTTSSHLAKLTEGRLLTVERHGRQRYYRLANPAVAEAIEALMAVAVDGPPRHRPPSKGEGAIRHARTCYDHLAGELGVGLTQAMIKRRMLRPIGQDFQLTSAGEKFLTGLGIELPRVRLQRRAFALQCLDWSERRPHLAGALGAALADHCLAQGWVRRLPAGRALAVSPSGRNAFKDLFGVALNPR